MEVKVLKRRCLVCGETLEIKVNKDRTYSGGHYFGKLGTKLVGTGKRIGTDYIGDTKVDIVDLDLGGKKVEYWECEKCYNDDT